MTEDSTKPKRRLVQCLVQIHVEIKLQHCSVCHKCNYKKWCHVQQTSPRAQLHAGATTRLI